MNNITIIPMETREYIVHSFACANFTSATILRVYSVETKAWNIFKPCSWNLVDSLMMFDVFFWIICDTSCGIISLRWNQQKSCTPNVRDTEVCCELGEQEHVGSRRPCRLFLPMQSARWQFARQFVMQYMNTRHDFEESWENRMLWMLKWPGLWCHKSHGFGCYICPRRLVIYPQFPSRSNIRTNNFHILI